MKLLCSCAFLISFFSASLLMGQGQPTHLAQVNDSEDNFVERDDSIYEDELDLVLDRWEGEIKKSVVDSDVSDLLGKLERERLMILEEDEQKTADLSALQKAYDLLMVKQQALVEEIKELTEELNEEDIDQSLSDDSIGAWDEENYIQKTQFYEAELSLVEQEIGRSESAQQLTLQEIEELREKRYELEVEIQDFQMLYGSNEALSEIDE